MPHKFILGHAVEYTPPRGLQAPPGIYVVIAKLSERDGEFEYYIKHISAGLTCARARMCRPPNSDIHCSRATAASASRDFTGSGTGVVDGVPDLK
jgi:hypothetical protein